MIIVTIVVVATIHHGSVRQVSSFVVSDAFLVLFTQTTDDASSSNVVVVDEHDEHTIIRRGLVHVAIVIVVVSDRHRHLCVQPSCVACQSESDDTYTVYAYAYSVRVIYSSLKVFTVCLSRRRMGEEDAETVAVDFPSSSSSPSKPRRRGVEGKRRGGRLFGDEDVEAVKDVVKDDDDCHDDDANVDKDEEDADDAEEKENHVVVECDDASEGGDDECDATAARETCTKDESPDDVPSRNVGEPAVETMDAMRRGGCTSPAASVESAT